MKNIISGILLIFTYINLNAQNQITNWGNLQVYPGATISICGNFVNNGVYIDNGASVSFNGNSNQVISGSSVNIFYNLEINNSFGVTLQQSAIVSNILTLTSGSLDLNSQTLTISNNSPSAITHINAYIISEKTDNSSKVKWNIGNNFASYTFPFGTTSGIYIPFVLNHTAGDIGNVMVSTYHTEIDNTPLPSIPTVVSNLNDIYGNDNSTNTVDRFWQIDKDGPAGTASLTFTASSDEVGSISNLIAQRWNTNTTEWDPPLPGQGNTSNTVMVPNVTNFSPWTLTGNNSLLPMELLSFTVNKNNNYAEINWVTVSEINNYGFDIEKSLDLYVWEKIGFVIGAGNSNRLISYYFNDPLDDNIKNKNTVIYYRLKQIDYNGICEYSDVRSLNLNISNQDIPVIFTLYPNPANQNIYITCDQPSQQFEVKVLNQIGSLIYKDLMTGNSYIDLSNLKAATYNIVFKNIDDGKVYSYKFIKIPN